MHAFSWSDHSEREKRNEKSVSQGKRTRKVAKACGDSVAGESARFAESKKSLSGGARAADKAETARQLMQALNALQIANREYILYS